MILYRRLNFIVLTNNLIVFGFLIFKKNLIHSKVNFRNNNLWVYKKLN